ncbi:tyrosine-type recombinase/integrase [Pseudomonas entomophila]|uniref:Tyrosine-type recombinase/integrase n=2 Tax=Pseudomonas entomophila TaxID=312306 RepID=A0ABY9QLE5_9PSED|nr:tyrosine-type recombinase/integrase [Pseudomonas entomophila]WMW04169.1 tyrosine-type recombinase/integrase [Pseudomonas entomophila]CAK15045.1 putative site-specific recombinase, integrase family [Pseudomonas entomophila L48]
MRPRKTENRHLPPRLYERKRKRKSGKVWVSYYCLDRSGKEITLGADLNIARLKWAELEAKDKPRDLLLMKAIFDRYQRDVIPKKAERTQKDNLAELRQLRPFFDEAPIDAITPALVAQYRDARSAPVRANREIALLSHVYNLAREWGFTTKENPCQGVRKNKETPRDFYANDAVWRAVYGKAVEELKVAMDLAYLTGQRPADVLVMRKDDIEDKALGVKQKKTHKKLRILLEVDGLASGLGVLIEEVLKRNAAHGSPYLILTDAGKRVTAAMLRHRWDDAREEAVKEATAAGDQVLASRISQFQFRDIRPKAASEIADVDHASLLLGHTKGDITERVYRRVGALAKPTK